MEIITGGNTSIYAGSDEIVKIFQGGSLIWEKDSDRPRWPAPYYYPDLSLDYGRGIGYWKDHFNSGETATFYFKSDDCEGEGGDRHFTYKSKTTGRTLNVDESSYTESIRVTANTDSNYFWLMPYSHYEAQNTAVPTFWSGCTALCYRQQQGSCGSLIRIPSDIDCSRIKLLVDISPATEYGEGISFAQLVKMCPNLKYIALHKNGTNTGNTFTLTGSSAWTLDSMRFTEWYCPGTTFIIENNSWWRSRIDWNIAAKRNITFKDSNGNIITQ